MIITCYRIYSGFRNVIDTITLVRPASDKIYDELHLVLPNGYEFADSVCGLPTVYDEKGAPCELCLNSLKGKTVLAISVNRAVGLKHAPKGSTPIPLQEARLAGGLTQKQLSEASGVNVRQIQRVELGESEAGNMTANSLIAIADALGVDPRDLI